jgi:hypothetical protein
MKTFFFLVLILLLFSLPAFSQQRWERTYGGASDEGGWSVRQTSDGGYIVAGYTGSFGNGTQVYLIKANASGDTLWTRHYWRGSGSECGRSVQQTLDGGYIIGGWIDYYGTYQAYLIKTNASGDTLWTRYYGGQGSDFGFSVQQTSDTGYIVAGAYDYSGFTPQAYLIKTNPLGDTLWTRTYGGTGSDGFNSVQLTTDGGYVVAGGTYSSGNNSIQVYLIKTNASGVALWTRNYGGAYYDYGYSVHQTSDGGFIVAGDYDYSGPNEQVYLIKTNASGDSLWTRNYGGTDYERGYSVQQTSDGGYIVAGQTASFGNAFQVYLIKTDANGNVGVETPVRQLDGSTVRQLKATPNPFTSFATLPGHEAERFSLYDISGRKVGTYKGDRIGEGLKAGVYFLRSSDSKDKPLRVVKVR